MARPASASGQRRYGSGASSPRPTRCTTPESTEPTRAGSSACNRSNASTRYSTSGRAAAICSALQIPRFAISRKRPPSARHARLASMKPSPVRLFSTIETPAPPVAASTASPNDGLRLSNTPTTPSERTYSCFPALAVAYTRSPAARAHWIAACPTPPAPACTSTVSPRDRFPNSNASAAVTNTTGTVASAAAGIPSGAGASSSARASASGPNVPAAKPRTRSPPAHPPPPRNRKPAPPPRTP